MIEHLCGPMHPLRARATLALFCAAALTIAALAGCEGIPSRESGAAPPSAAPPDAAPQPAVPAHVPAGTPRFEVKADESEIRLLVGREGPLSELGHSHVIIAPVHGELYSTDAVASSGFTLEIRVQEFEVDPPTARAEEGPAFASPVPDAARQGTRTNMLGSEVLNAAAFPAIRIESVALSGPPWNPDVSVRISVRGTTRDVDFPCAVIHTGNEITVIANFTVRQSDLGITPYSVLGGGLKVSDAIRVRARIVARRVS